MMRSWSQPQMLSYPVAATNFQQPQPRNLGRITLRILVVSWNMASRLQSMDKVARLLSPERMSTHDIIVVGTQECEDKQWIAFCKNRKTNWQQELNMHMFGSFSLVGKQAFHGTHIIAYARPKLIPFISKPKEGHTFAGFKGITGSKAAVGLFFKVGLKSFNFINCHLKADHHNTAKRNEGLYRVLRRLELSRDSDETYLFGDLNYRIQMTKEQARFFTTSTDAEQYKQRDQLYLEASLDNFLQVFAEGPRTFGPTYKLSKHEHRYQNERIPGWTDRIFFQSVRNETSLQWYIADFTVLGSDHRPVLASFRTSATLPINQMRY